MNDVASGAGSPTVVVADPLALRRAELASFLKDWAEANRFSVRTVPPDEIPGALAPSMRVVLGLLNTGAASVCEPSYFGWLNGIRKAIPRAPVMIVSDLEDHKEVALAFRAGARGFLPSSTEPEVALATLSFVMQGGSFFPRNALLGGEPMTSCRPTLLHPLPFTPRQKAVLIQVRAGMPNKVIAKRLGVEESTVKDHIKAIMRKLGAKNRTQVAFAVENGTLAEALPAFPGKTGGMDCASIHGSNSNLNMQTPVEIVRPEQSRRMTLHVRAKLV